MRWKWVAGLAGLLIVVLIGVLYVIVTTYDFNKLKPRIIQAVREATGRELTLAGDFKVHFGLSPSASVEGVSFQNVSWGTRPEMARIKGLEIQVSLLPLIRGEVEFKRLIFREPDILIETDPSGKLNLEFKPLEKPRAEEKKPEPGGGLPPLVFEEVRIEKGILTYRDGKKGKTFALKVDQLTASLPGEENPIGLKVKGSFNGRPLELEGTAGPLKGLFSPGKPWPLNLTAKVEGTTVGVEGTVGEPLKGKGMNLAVRAEGASLRKAAEFAGVSGIPDLGAFKISARITDPAEKIAVSGLKAQVGETEVSGSAELSLSGPRPRVAADLSSSKLDLRPFFPKEQKKAPETKPSPKPGAGGKEKVFPTEPLPLEGLKALDGDVKLHAEQILGLPVSVGRFNTQVALENGNLSVKPFQCVLAGGGVNGVFTLRTQDKEPSFICRLKMDQLEVASLLKDLGVKELLEGKVDGEIDLSGKGKSIAAWMAGLNGRTRLVMGKGRLQEKYLDILGADLARSLLRLINPFQKGDDFTPLNCLVNGFEVKDGLAVCTALVLDTPQMSLAGEGDIDLKTEKLNLSIHPYPKSGVGGGGLGKVSLSLGELTNPFKLGGTLAHPSLAIDTTRALITAGKAVGGMALLGPAGILTALASTGPGDANACLAAIESAKKKGKPGASEKPEKKKGVADEVKEGVKEIEKGLKEFLKK
jgi:AsmA family protein